MKDIERRHIKTDLEVRAENEGRTITGYAAVFNQPADIGSFTEEIETSFFEGRLNDDVVALFNHDPNMILARNGVSMTLEVDAVGLRYTFEAPDTTTGNDVLKSIQRGDIKASSFAFTVEEMIFDYREGEKPHRRLVKAEKIYDVSPVTYPAYESTSVSARTEQLVSDLIKANEAENTKEIDPAYYIQIAHGTI